MQNLYEKSMNHHQDLSLIDARKGLNMFKKVNVPILGIIENMSYFLCTTCDTKHPIFGNGGAKIEAEKLMLVKDEEIKNLKKEI